MNAAMARHNACLLAAIETHRGQIFNTVGDGFFAAFAEPSDALRAALAAQQSLHVPQSSAAPTGAEREVFLKVRMALHTGAVSSVEATTVAPLFIAPLGSWRRRAAARCCCRAPL